MEREVTNHPVPLKIPDQTVHTIASYGPFCVIRERNICSMYKLRRYVFISLDIEAYLSLQSPSTLKPQSYQDWNSRFLIWLLIILWVPIDSTCVLPAGTLVVFEKDSLTVLVLGLSTCHFVSHVTSHVTRSVVVPLDAWSRVLKSGLCVDRAARVAFSPDCLGMCSDQNTFVYGRSFWLFSAP